MQLCFTFLELFTQIILHCKALSVNQWITLLFDSRKNQFRHNKSSCRKWMPFLRIWYFWVYLSLTYSNFSVQLIKFCHKYLDVVPKLMANPYITTWAIIHSICWEIELLAGIHFIPSNNSIKKYFLWKVLILFFFCCCYWKVESTSITKSNNVLSQTTNTI
jgi:hypothetical protein